MGFWSKFDKRNNDIFSDQFKIYKNYIYPEERVNIIKLDDNYPYSSSQFFIYANMDDGIIMSQAYCATKRIKDGKSDYLIVYKSHYEYDKADEILNKPHKDYTPPSQQDGWERYVELWQAR